MLDLVVATCTAALAGAMSVVPPDPRRVAGVVPSASRPCPDVLCTGESLTFFAGLAGSHPVRAQIISKLQQQVDTAGRG